MKRIAIVSMFITMMLASCEFHQSVETNLLTGAVSRGDGLGCDDISMMINGKMETRNVFSYGEKVILVFNDIRGLETEDGKTFPGLSMHILMNESDTVLSEANLLDELSDGTALSPLQLQASFTAAYPYKGGEEYKVHVLIRDLKGDGSFFYELPFEIRESELLDVRTYNMDYSVLYLWNESRQEAVTDNVVGQDEVLMLIIEGVTGMVSKEGKVFPGFSIEIVDDGGHVILSEPNVLAEYEEEGVDEAGLAEGQVPVTITFDEGLIESPCKLTAVVKDLLSDSRIEIFTELILE
jgi:hypothetical protein